MNIIEAFKFAGKVHKAMKEVNKFKETNSEIADKIEEIIDDIIKLLGKVKDVVPVIDGLVEEIIEFIKKHFRKEK